MSTFPQVEKLKNPRDSQSDAAAIQSPETVPLSEEIIAEIKARADAITPGEWEHSAHQKFEDGWPAPSQWTYVQHNFPEYPYEGALDEEYGIYPPLGESGPVALVSGPENAAFFARAPADIRLLLAEIERLKAVHL